MLLVGGCQASVSICVSFCHSYLQPHMSLLVGPFFIQSGSNLIQFGSYNLRQKDLSVVAVGFHRAFAVTAGVLWAALVSRFWWPAEARRELSKLLSEFSVTLQVVRLEKSHVDLGSAWISVGYTPVWLPPTHFLPSTGGKKAKENLQFVARDVFILHVSRILFKSSWPCEFMIANLFQILNLLRELHLQIKLIGLQNLLSETQHEPRLKGPFPVVLYRQILTSLQTILDKLHSMRCVTTKEEWLVVQQLNFWS